MGGVLKIDLTFSRERFRIINGKKKISHLFLERDQNCLRLARKRIIKVNSHLFMNTLRRVGRGSRGMFVPTRHQHRPIDLLREV